MENKKVGKTHRTSKILIAAFGDHLVLLNSYVKELENGDKKYYKAIMAELRVLVYESRTNKPLLSRLAAQHNIDPVVYENGKQMSLKKYLNQALFVIPLPPSFSQRGDNYLTRIEFIIKASQQEGSAHEDDALDNDLLLFKGEKSGDPFFGISFNGNPPHIEQAIKIAKCIYSCGIMVLKDIQNKARSTSKNSVIR
jgi:hypothetical protein